MTRLSECNIQALDELKKRIINPYVYGHSFRFCGIDLVLASVHQFSVYASEQPIRDINEDGGDGSDKSNYRKYEIKKGFLPAQVDEQ